MLRPGLTLYLVRSTNASKLIILIDTERSIRAVIIYILKSYYVLLWKYITKFLLKKYAQKCLVSYLTLLREGSLPMA